MKDENKPNKNLFEFPKTVFLKLCSFVSPSKSDLCHNISAYYQDKYNMCATLFLGPPSKFRPS